MSDQDEIVGRMCVAVLGKLGRAVEEDFLASEAFRSLDPEAKDILYVWDAAVAEEHCRRARKS
ncbi:hypothetical protein OIE66_18540 [Nonomuraea sp. NBC_01738]|uniref:hypothetical protein n=1 Tax=Nonomuraea sp. NBC_01738 TaxID=2976003 RepID=UPI002E112020|nr:hypothetical protein OIE66_18540 [Nonomuraea sp. NBC_01738]